MPTMIVAAASSAWSGTRNRGCTDASQRGRSPFAAIANAVRLTPAISDSNTPSDAIAAPTRTTGPSIGQPLLSTTATSGAGVRAISAPPTAASALTATSAYTASAMASASGMARGIVRVGATTSSPSVAIRAYPANAKNRKPAACSVSYPPGTDDGNARDHSALPLPSDAATTSARHTSTITTMTFVAPAVLVTPR